MGSSICPSEESSPWESGQVPLVLNRAARPHRRRRLWRALCSVRLWLPWQLGARHHSQIRGGQNLAGARDCAAIHPGRGTEPPLRFAELLDVIRMKFHSASSCNVHGTFGLRTSEVYQGLCASQEIFYTRGTERSPRHDHAKVYSIRAPLSGGLPLRPDDISGYDEGVSSIRDGLCVKYLIRA